MANGVGFGGGKRAEGSVPKLGPQFIDLWALMGPHGSHR